MPFDLDLLPLAGLKPGVLELFDLVAQKIETLLSFPCPGLEVASLPLQPAQFLGQPGHLFASRRQPEVIIEVEQVVFHLEQEDMVVLAVDIHQGRTDLP